MRLGRGAWRTGILVCLGASLGACRSPTQISVQVQSDVCSQVTSTAFTSGELPSLDDVPPTSVSTSCNGNHIGTVVLLPSGDDNAEVGFKVVTALNGETLDQCSGAGAANDKNCIVARRQLRYLPHTSLTVVVGMLQDCAGIVCQPDSTCVSQQCVSATISDPTDCEGAGCQSDALGPPVDGGGDGGGAGDATVAGDATAFGDANGGSPDAPSNDAPFDTGAGEGSDAKVATGDAALAAVPGCDTGGLLVGAAWPMEAYCPSGRNRTSLLGPTAMPTHKWTFRPGGFLSDPSIAPDGRLFVGTFGGSLVSLAPANGGTLWTFDGGGTSYQMLPALAADGTLRLFDLSRGEYRAVSLAGVAGPATVVGMARGSVTIVGDGTMYFTTNEGQLVALNGDGTQRWLVAGDSDDYTLPVVGADGTVFSHDNETGLYAIAADGGTKWGTTLDSGVIENVAVAVDGTLRAITTVTGRVYALNAATGAVTWSAIADPAGAQGMSIDDDGNTFVSGAQTLSSWSSAGTRTASTDHGCVAVTIDQAGNLYSVCDGGQVTMFDHALNLKWQVPIPTYLGGFSDGVVIGPGGALYAITDGSLDASASNADTTAIDAFGP